MSLQEFKSNFLGGGARPNQFRVELTMPGIAQNGFEAGRRAQFLCNAASLPASDIGVAPVFFRGRQLPLAGERTFQPWTITVLNDTDFTIRNSFESWMHAINDLQFNTGITTPGIYTSDMSVHQLDRNGQTIKSYKFVGAWPKNVSEIQLGFNQNDVVEEFQVTFEYMHYMTDFNTPSIGLTVNI
jgi:hypothetical protein